VFAGAEGGERVGVVIGGGRGEEDCLDAAIGEQFVEGGVGGLAAIEFLEGGAAIGAEVGDGDDLAVGVFVKLERVAEAAADDADAELAGRGGLRAQSEARGEREGGDGRSGESEEGAAGERWHGRNRAIGASG
jgi:hypothetical protein